MDDGICPGDVEVEQTGKRIRRYVLVSCGMENRRCEKVC